LIFRKTPAILSSLRLILLCVWIQDGIIIYFNSNHRIRRFEFFPMQMAKGMLGLFAATEAIISQLEGLIDQIREDDYTKPLDILSGSSVGQHMRHVIEFYQCVVTNQGSNEINYDNRERDKILETSLDATLKVLATTKDGLNSIRTDRDIYVSGQIGGTGNKVRSSIKREILYAIEHAVHHMAIIKIGVKTSLPYISLPDSFGVAESTIRYRKECAQ